MEITKKIKSMMDNAKDWIVDHKTPLIIAGLGVGGYLFYKHQKKNDYVEAIDVLHTQPQIVPYGVANSAPTPGVGYSNQDLSGIVNDMTKAMTDMQGDYDKAIDQMRSDQQKMYADQNKAISGVYTDFNKALEDMSKSINVTKEETTSQIRDYNYSNIGVPQADPYASNASWDNRPGYGLQDSSQKFGVRQYFEGLGYSVGWDEASREFTVGNMRFGSGGFDNNNNRLYASQNQLNEISNSLARNKISKARYDNTTPISVRGVLEAAGHNVSWDASNATMPLIVDGKRYNVNKFDNRDGHLYATRQTIANTFGV